MNWIKPKLCSSFADSSLATGTTNLLNDISSWLIGISLIVGAVMIAYSAIRYGAADNVQDKEEYKKKIKVSIIATIIATIGSSLLKLLVGYYQ